MSIRIEYGYPTPLNDFLRIIELDKKTYGEDIITNYDYTIGRYNKCSDCIIRVYDDNIFIGAMTMYPITDEFVEIIYKSDEYLDDNISPDFIVPLQKDKINNLIIVDIIVDNKYRGQKISYKIIDAMNEFTKEQNRNGYKIGKIFAYAITDAGKNVSQKNNCIIVKQISNEIGYLFYFNPQT